MFLVKIICMLLMIIAADLAVAKSDAGKCYSSSQYSHKLAIIPVSSVPASRPMQAVYKNSTTALYSSLSFINKQPPSGFIYLTFGIAVITLLTNLVGFMFKRNDRFND